MSQPEPPVPVHLLALPVAVHARAREHTDALLREFRLIAEQLERPSSASVPVRLAQLVHTLNAGYSGFTIEQEDALEAALLAGKESLDLTFHVPSHAMDAARRLGALLDEADEYCRAGRHLLTLAAPADLVSYRHWYLDQFISQIGGAPPVPWTAWPQR